MPSTCTIYKPPQELNLPRNIKESSRLKPAQPLSPEVVIVNTSIIITITITTNTTITITAIVDTTTINITSIILISTFSKVSVPVQNWAAVVERWRRRIRRRGRRRCACGTDQSPTWGGRGRGSRASSPLMMGPHLSHSEIKEALMIQPAN